VSVILILGVVQKVEIIGARQQPIKYKVLGVSG